MLTYYIKAIVCKRTCRETKKYKNEHINQNKFKTWRFMELSKIYKM